MYCAECGTQLATWAKFCRSCGVPTEATTIHESAVSEMPGYLGYQETRWELCSVTQIAHRVTLTGTIPIHPRLIVRVVSPAGEVVAHEEALPLDHWNAAKNARSKAEAVRRLTSALLANGWEPMPGDLDTPTFRHPFVPGRQKVL